MGLKKRVPICGYITTGTGNTGTESAQRLSLYQMNGLLTAVTLAAGDQVFITDVFMYTATAGVMQLYDGPDNTPSGGEIIYETKPANTGNNNEHTFATPRGCQIATGSDGTGYPKLKTSGDVAAQTCGIVGYVMVNQA